MRKKNIIFTVVAIVMMVFGIVGWKMATVPSEIIVTQYPDITGSQAMFYTLEVKNKLYVIDGGTIGNAAYVQQVIAEKGNKVEGWILTHPHPDHIGAFVGIYMNPGETEIKTIYAENMDYETFKANAKPWSGFGIYDLFYQLTKDAGNLVYLYEGDVLEFPGMTIEWYHSFDLETAFLEPHQDLINWGSMVFEVYGETESMLFCSDLFGEAACNFVMGRHGDKLSADYFQIGHHGNQSVTHEFVQAVNPKFVFFDAPWALIVDINYDTQQNIDFCTEQGMEVVTYMTAPNQVVIH